MLFDRLIRRIGRTARGSAAKKHQVVYYDIRVNNVESAWSAVRIVWISGTGKQTRYAAAHSLITRLAEQIAQSSCRITSFSQQIYVSAWISWIAFVNECSVAS